MAYLAYYFHWPYEQVMNLDHLERRRWTVELARLNRRVGEASAADEGARI